LEPVPQTSRRQQFAYSGHLPIREPEPFGLTATKSRSFDHSLIDPHDSVGDSTFLPPFYRILKLTLLPQLATGPKDKIRQRIKEQIPQQNHFVQPTLLTRVGLLDQASEGICHFRSLEVQLRIHFSRSIKSKIWDRGNWSSACDSSFCNLIQLPREERLHTEGQNVV
jgi:hypothetical protein